MRERQDERFLGGSGPEARGRVALGRAICEVGGTWFAPAASMIPRPLPTIVPLANTGRLSFFQHADSQESSTRSRSRPCVSDFQYNANAASFFFRCSVWIWLLMRRLFFFFQLSMRLAETTWACLAIPRAIPRAMPPSSSSSLFLLLLDALFCCEC